MIELYTFPTPNGQKVHIMLEELGLPYEVHVVDITKGQQFEAEFLRISPNNKIPALVDRDGPGGERFPLFESGAILMYLAEKADSSLWPRDDMRRKYDVMQWLMFQMGHIGPLLGQANHFRRYAPETIDYAIERYTNEATRLYKVVDKQLAQRDYLAGEHSIADIAVFPWLRGYERQGQKLEDYPNLKRWYEAIKARPAVQRGIEVAKDATPQQGFDQQARENLFGKKQYQRE